jgi:4-hydroxy-tetrahydrodipicolinate synthase
LNYHPPANHVNQPVIDTDRKSADITCRGSHTTALPAGIISSSVTPFTGNGEFCASQLRDHVEWLLAEGTDGLSPLGSSGEFAALEVEVRKRILEEVLRINNGRVPVWAGTHHYSTRTTIELSRHAEAAGADALLIVPPYYMSPTLAQAKNHYRQIAAAVSIPIVLYHNVILTNVDFKTADLKELWDEGAIGGVKMSNPEADRICQLQQQVPEMPTYCGIDSVAFEGLCHGAHGWISGIPSIVPRAAKELYLAICASDLPRARKLWIPLAALMRFQFSAYLNGGPGAHWFSAMKATLNLIGPPVGNPEPPLGPLEPEYLGQLTDILTQLGYRTPVISA